MGDAERARWAMLRARWVTLRAGGRWESSLGDAKSSLGCAKACCVILIMPWLFSVFVRGAPSDNVQRWKSCVV
jgi:hypothetical protein